MRNFARNLFSFVCVLSFMFIPIKSYALDSSYSLDTLETYCMEYETNITETLSNGYWEFPVSDDEFSADLPKGVYIKPSDISDLYKKYEEYLSLSNQVGLRDSEVFPEDVDNATLTKEELLTLSDVYFSYFRNTDDGYIIQQYEVYWVDGTYQCGYIVWDLNGFVVEFRQF